MSYKATAWAYDLPLKGPKKFILVALADMADEAQSCFPGQQTLADMTGCSVKTVERSLAALGRMGLLSRQHRYSDHGWRTSDRFFLHIDVVALPEATADEQLDGPTNVLPDTLSGSHTEDDEGQRVGGAGQRVASAGVTTRLSVPRLPDTESGQREPKGSLEPPEGTPRSLGAVVNVHRSTSTAATTTFEAFWAVYPRKVDQPAARKAWTKAIQRATPDDIVAGAQRYRDDPSRDPQYTKHPGPWLNGDRWTDEPLPARNNLPNGPSPTDRITAMRNAALNTTERNSNGNHPGMRRPAHIPLGA